MSDSRSLASSALRDDAAAQTFTEELRAEADRIERELEPVRFNVAMTLLRRAACALEDVGSSYVRQTERARDLEDALESAYRALSERARRNQRVRDRIQALLPTIKGSKPARAALSPVPPSEEAQP